LFFGHFMTIVRRTRRVCPDPVLPGSFWHSAPVEFQVLSRDSGRWVPASAGSAPPFTTIPKKSHEPRNGAIIAHRSTRKTTLVYRLLQHPPSTSTTNARFSRMIPTIWTRARHHDSGRPPRWQCKDTASISSIPRRACLFRRRCPKRILTMVERARCCWSNAAEGPLPTNSWGRGAANVLHKPRPSSTRRRSRPRPVEVITSVRAFAALYASEEPTPISRSLMVSAKQGWYMATTLRVRNRPTHASEAFFDLNPHPRQAPLVRRPRSAFPPAQAPILASNP